MIQGFPIDFIFFGSDLEKIKQIGNAISPPFVKHITSYIKDVIVGDIVEMWIYVLLINKTKIDMTTKYVTNLKYTDKYTH